MSIPVFIGDEISASGYRLAGAQVRIAAPEQLMETLNAVNEDAPLVLIAAGVATQLSDAQLQQVLSRITPPVVVVPDLRGRSRLIDLASRLRKQLGVLE